MSDLAKQNDVFRNLDDFSGMASDWFWETDADHRFCYFSRRMEEVTKFDTSALMGQRRDIIPNEDLRDPKWLRHKDDLANHRPFRNFEYEMRRPHDGTLLWVRIAGKPQFDADGNFTGYRGTGHDVTQEKVAMQRLQDSNRALAARNKELDQAKKTIERSALEDTLTGLCNRRAFESDLEKGLGQSRNGLALLHVDLDRFKWVNDTLGHPSGDHVLCVTADRLRSVVGQRGRVYRVGGDEFMVILRSVTAVEQAASLAQELVAALAVPFQPGNQRVTVGASVGVALATKDEMDSGKLISHADAALYEAKRGGRNCVRCSTPCLQARIDDERRLSFDIPRALERREFIPFFQPQVDVATGQVIGAEALVRWQHPERGLLTPHAFLRAATELGKIDLIDRLVLEQSSEVVARLERRGIALPSLSINVSEARLADPHLYRDIGQLWGSKSCQLAIELLETINFDENVNGDLFTESLKQLRQLGVRIETDDFGSGRASITGLLHIAPDRIKIDRHLVQNVADSPQERSLVRGILDMCSALDIDCIVEGVETEAAIQTIAQLGCSKFQGFAISHPLCEKDFVTYLSAPIKLPSLEAVRQTRRPDAIAHASGQRRTLTGLPIGRIAHLPK